MTGGLAALALACVIFVGSHLVASAPALRPRLIAALGERLFRALHGGLSLLILAWVIAAYRAAPMVPLWDLGRAGAWLLFVLMAATSLLFVAGVTTPHPKITTGSTRDLSPGILSVTRHPLLWAVALWAGGHLAVNGHGASVIFFSSMLLLAVLGMKPVMAKRRAALSGAAARYEAETSTLPLAAILSKRTRFKAAGIGWWRLIGAVLLFTLLLVAHGWVIGRYPLDAL